MKASATLLALVAVCVARPAAAAPDVILITADTLRADHLGAYGYFRATSPAIDRLSRESVQFDNAYAPMAMTLPSHLSLMTAANPVRHGILSNLVTFRRGFVAERGIETAAAIFRRAGYATAAFTSASPLSTETGIDAGFEVFEGPAADTKGRPLVDLRAEDTVARALAWLARASRPFFLWVHLFDPHHPYAAPPPFDRAFVDRGETFAFLAERGFARAAYERAAALANGYDGEILYMDGRIERLLAALAARGLYDGALILFAGDHGEGLLQRGRRGHGLVWNEEVRVPLLLRLPRARRVERRAGLASLVDVLPTIAAAVGIALPVRLDGIDLLDEERASVLLQRTAGSGRRDKQYALLTREWKYVESIAAQEPDALYHIGRDPHETRNVIERFADRAARMQEELLAAVAAAGAGAENGVEPVSPAQRERLRQLGYEE
jgi:arylsulfatase A-like enzyme